MSSSASRNAPERAMNQWNMLAADDGQADAEHDARHAEQEPEPQTLGLGVAKLGDDEAEADDQQADGDDEHGWRLAGQPGASWLRRSAESPWQLRMVQPGDQQRCPACGEPGYERMDYRQHDGYRWVGWHCLHCGHGQEDQQLRLAGQPVPGQRLRVSIESMLGGPTKVYEGTVVSVRDGVLSLQTALQEQPITFSLGPHLHIERLAGAREQLRALQSPVTGPPVGDPSVDQRSPAASPHGMPDGTSVRNPAQQALDVWDIEHLGPVSPISPAGPPRRVTPSGARAYDTSAADMLRRHLLTDREPGVALRTPGVPNLGLGVSQGDAELPDQEPGHDTQSVADTSALAHIVDRPACQARAPAPGPETWDSAWSYGTSAARSKPSELAMRAPLSEHKRAHRNPGWSLEKFRPTRNRVSHEHEAMHSMQGAQVPGGILPESGQMSNVPVGAQARAGAHGRAAGQVVGTDAGPYESSGRMDELAQEPHSLRSVRRDQGPESYGLGSLTGTRESGGSQHIAMARTHESNARRNAEVSISMPLVSREDQPGSGAEWIWPSPIGTQGTPHVAGPARYFHATDAELQPGDEIAPAAERGFAGNYPNAERYDPHSVYLFDRNTTDGVVDSWGRQHIYEVEPLGEVRPDPERGIGGPYDYEEDDPSYGSWITPRARVVRKIPNDGMARWQYDDPFRLGKLAAEDSPYRRASIFPLDEDAYEHVIRETGAKRDGNFLVYPEGEVNLWAHNHPNGNLLISDIEAWPQGAGLGGRVVNSLQNYAQATNRRIALEGVTNPEFWHHMGWDSSVWHPHGIYGSHKWAPRPSGTPRVSVQADPHLSALLGPESGSHVAVRVRHENLPHVLQHGVPNVFTHMAPGDDRDEGYLRMRQNTESLFSKPPIYGYMATPDEHLTDNHVRAFGDAKLILKPHVRDNTTFTYSDSVFGGMGSPGGPIPASVNTPTMEAVPERFRPHIPFIKQLHVNIGDERNPEPPLPDHLRKMKETAEYFARQGWAEAPRKRMDYNEAADAYLRQIERQGQWSPHRFGDFFEAQIHQPVMPHDIAAIVSPHPATPEIAQMASQHGIPYFRFDHEPQEHLWDSPWKLTKVIDPLSMAENEWRQEHGLRTSAYEKRDRVELKSQPGKVYEVFSNGPHGDKGYWLLAEDDVHNMLYDVPEDAIAGHTGIDPPHWAHNPFHKLATGYVGPLTLEGYHNSSHEGVEGVRREGFDFSRHKRGTWGTGAYAFLGAHGEGYNPGGPGEASTPIRLKLNNGIHTVLDQVGAIDRHDPGTQLMEGIWKQADAWDPHSRREALLKAGYDGVMVSKYMNNPYCAVAFDHPNYEILNDRVRSGSGLMAVGNEQPRPGEYQYVAGQDRVPTDTIPSLHAHVTSVNPWKFSGPPPPMMYEDSDIPEGWTLQQWRAQNPLAKPPIIHCPHCQAGVRADLGYCPQCRSPLIYTAKTAGPIQGIKDFFNMPSENYYPNGTHQCANCEQTFVRQGPRYRPIAPVESIWTHNECPSCGVPLSGRTMPRHLYAQGWRVQPREAGLKGSTDEGELPEPAWHGMFDPETGEMRQPEPVAPLFEPGTPIVYHNPLGEQYEEGGEFHPDRLHGAQGYYIGPDRHYPGAHHVNFPGHGANWVMHYNLRPRDAADDPTWGEFWRGSNTRPGSEFALKNEEREPITGPWRISGPMRDWMQKAFFGELPPAPTPQELAQGRQCFMHPDRPAVAAEAFMAMCPDCYRDYKTRERMRELGVQRTPPTPWEPSERARENIRGPLPSWPETLSHRHKRSADPYPETPDTDSIGGDEKFWQEFEDEHQPNSHHLTGPEALVPWQFGKEAKGLVMHDGSVVTWQHPFIHHPEVAQMLGPEKVRRNINAIDIDGTARLDFDADDWDHEAVKRAGLRPTRDTWDFGGPTNFVPADERIPGVEY